MLVAETETVAPFNACESFAIAALLRGPIFGRFPIICTETFAMPNPAFVTRSSVSLNKVSPEAPAYFGSEVPKLEPRSPIFAAAKSASQIACAATSPS